MDTAAPDDEAPKTPSQRIIKTKFGGIRATARRFDKPPTTVQHWYTHRIPAKYQQMFLDGAREDGVDLTPADFFVATGDEIERDGPVDESRVA